MIIAYFTWSMMPLQITTMLVDMNGKCERGICIHDPSFQLCQNPAVSDIFVGFGGALNPAPPDLFLL